MGQKYLHLCFVAPDAYPLLSDAEYGTSCGAEVQQFLIAKALVDRDYRVTFIVNDFGQKEREVHSSIEVIKGPFRYLGGSNMHFFVDTWRLVMLLLRISADFNLLKTPTSLLFAMGLHRYLFGGRLVKIIASDQDCAYCNKKLVSRLYPWGTKALDYTIFQSEYQKKQGSKNLGLKGTVIKNIAHSVNFIDQHFEKNIDVLWIGSSDITKQPDVFLDLAEQLTEISFTMVMADGTDRQFQGHIEKRAKATPNVDYKGAVAYNRTWSYYKRAKILVCTSQSEGFPNIFLQAWQTSIPIVSLSIDPDNVISDNHLGFVSGNLDKMKKDIKLLLAKDNLRRELGKNGKTYVDKNHSSEVIIRQFINVLEALKP